MKTAVIYARYSSERQTEQSIEGQVRVCTEYAARHDIVIVDKYIDRAMTGTNDNRTDFQRMLKDCTKRAWDIVLVYKLDRFSRNKYETAIHKKTLRDHGVQLVSAMENIPNTPEGIIMESLLEGMAEYYSAELSQKVKRGMNESRHKGNFTGGSILYGFKIVNKKVLINEFEGNIVYRIFSEFASGKFVKDIIKDLTDEGIYYKGKPFPLNVVYYMLGNEKYAGVYTYNNEVFTNTYPKIVPKELFEIVKNKLEENKYGKHSNDVQYLLKNIMTCGYCGKSITSESGTARNGTTKRYYKCSSRKRSLGKCRKTTVRKEEIENLVVDTTIKVLSNPSIINNIAEKILESHNQKSKDRTVLNLLLKERQETQRSINNILTAMEIGVITSSTKNRLEELESKLDIVEGKILFEQSQNKIELNKQDIIKYINKSIKKSPQLMIKLLIDHIILYDDKIEIYYKFTENKRPDDSKHQVFCFYNEMVSLHIWDYISHVVEKMKFEVLLYS